MPDPPSPSIPKDPRDEEFSNFIKKGRDTGEPISVAPPCINTNRLSQMTTGPGRNETRKSGKKRMTGSRNSTSTGVRPPTVPTCLNGSLIRYRWEARELTGLFSQAQHWTTRSPSQSHTTIRTTAYWVSVRLKKDAKEALCSLASLEPVRLND